jgi:hypothetical protein
MSESSGFVCQTGTAYGLLKRLAILSGGAKLSNKFNISHIRLLKGLVKLHVASVELKWFILNAL